MDEYNTFITNSNINNLDELSATLSSELPIELNQITSDNKNGENSLNDDVNNLVNVINSYQLLAQTNNFQTSSGTNLQSLYSNLNTDQVDSCAQLNNDSINNPNANYSSLWRDYSNLNCNSINPNPDSPQGSSNSSLQASSGIGIYSHSNSFHSG